MKISIAIQYYNRRYQLLNTIHSISQTIIPSNDYEVIIVDDASDVDHDISDIQDLYPDIDIKLFKFNKDEKWWSCPVLPLNKSIAMCTGDAIIIMGAEMMFVGDIIKDVSDRISANDYLVYATLALNADDTQNMSMMSYDDIINKRFTAKAPPGHHGGWYQHSIYRNACFNFCTAIMRKDLLDLGGFDERFAWGVSHGDDNFLDRVKIKGMNIISIDEPMTYHQYHPSMQVHPITDKPVDGALLNITRQEPGYKVTNSFIGS